MPGHASIRAARSGLGLVRLHVYHGINDIGHVSQDPIAYAMSEFVRIAE